MPLWIVDKSIIDSFHSLNYVMKFQNFTHNSRRKYITYILILFQLMSKYVKLLLQGIIPTCGWYRTQQKVQHEGSSIFPKYKNMKPRQSD